MFVTDQIMLFFPSGWLVLRFYNVHINCIKLKIQGLIYMEILAHCRRNMTKGMEQEQLDAVTPDIILCRGF